MVAPAPIAAWRQLAAVAALPLLGCEPAAYKAPQVPEHQLTIVEVESRAKVLSIDGRPPAEPGEPAPEWFWVSSNECHEVVLYYKETYVRNGGGVYVAFFDPAAFVASVAATAGAQASKLRFYETDMPIRFYLPPKAGVKYWMTSTFDGDQFKPRVAVLDSEGERADVILPEQPCPDPEAEWK